MKVNSPLLGFLLSLICLSALIALWPSGFLLYKVMSFPAWAGFLPQSIHWPAILATITLVPVVLCSVNFRSAFESVCLVVLLSPIAALLGYSLQQEGQLNLANLINLLINLAFHYIWVIGFHLLIPSIVVLSMTYFFRFLTRKRLMFKS